jgi:hypothetical protein
VERDALPQGQGAGSVTQVVEANLYRETSLLEKSPKRAYPANQEVGPSRKPDSALRRLMAIRVPDDVGECPWGADFRRILVGACRSESDDVGVGWGQEWGQRSKSNWLP